MTCRAPRLPCGHGVRQSRFDLRRRSRIFTRSFHRCGTASDRRLFDSRAKTSFQAAVRPRPNRPSAVRFPLSRRNCAKRWHCLSGNSAMCRTSSFRSKTENSDPANALGQAYAAGSASLRRGLRNEAHDPAQALKRVNGLDFDKLARRHFVDVQEPPRKRPARVQGIAVGGAASIRHRRRLAARGDPIVLVRPDPIRPISGIPVSAGIPTRTVTGPRMRRWLRVKWASLVSLDVGH